MEFAVQESKIISRQYSYTWTSLLTRTCPEDHTRPDQTKARALFLFYFFWYRAESTISQWYLVIGQHLGLLLRQRCLGSCWTGSKSCCWPGACEPMQNDPSELLSFCVPSLWNQSWVQLHQMCKLSDLSHVWLFATPWTVAHQALLSMGFSRKEYWSGLPFLSSGDLPHPGSNLCLLHCRQILYLWATREAPWVHLPLHNKINLLTHDCSEGKCTFISGHQARRGVVDCDQLVEIEKWNIFCLISKQRCHRHQ